MGKGEWDGMRELGKWDGVSGEGRVGWDEGVG